MIFPFFSHTNCPVWLEGRICARQGWERGLETEVGAQSWRAWMPASTSQALKAQKAEARVPMGRGGEGSWTRSLQQEAAAKLQVRDAEEKRSG
jgi:hypothetical protein